MLQGKKVLLGFYWFWGTSKTPQFCGTLCGTRKSEKPKSLDISRLFCFRDLMNGNKWKLQSDLSNNEPTAWSAPCCGFFICDIIEFDELNLIKEVVEIKKKVLTVSVVAAMLVLVFSIFASNPIISCKAELPESYLSAIESQSKGVYSNRLPLVPIYISVDGFSDEKATYTIYYFPFGTVGMAYTAHDGYSIEKPLTDW